MEEWRDVVGYEGLYQVSNHGRVKSLDRQVRNKNGMTLIRGQILSPGHVGYKGQYCQVALWKENQKKLYLVHRLVAVAFHPNPDNMPEVNHIDENTLNNRADNLEWITMERNKRYGTCIQRGAEKRRGKPIGGHPILQYTTEGVFIAKHASAIEAAAHVGGNNSLICRCANGKLKSSCGFVWKWE